MGTYISIPYVTRRSVHVEPSKPVVTVDTIVEPLVCEKEVNEEPKEEPKEEAKEEPKEEPKNVVIEAEQVIPELLPKRLSITISSESDVVPVPSEQVVQRIPEFQGNMNSESHAIKKFNRRHRKHLKN
jgi:hypothetical protein